jgi:Tfp pilus assembly protein PilO
MKQSSKRFTSMLLALLFVVAALVIFFDLIQPAYTDLKTKKGQQLSDESILSEEQHVVDQAKNLLAQYQNEAQQQETLALAMPSGPNAASALAQVYGIAQNNGVVLQNVAIAAPTVQRPADPQASGNAGASLSLSQVTKPVGTLSFQLTAAGSYESLKNFLAQLETNIRIFDLKAFSLQAGPTAGAKGAAQSLFTYNLTVETYYQLP